MKAEKIKPFESKFLNNDLKAKVDSVTSRNVDEVKKELADYIRANFKTAERDVQRLDTKKTAKDVQFFFYNYILVSTGNKVI